MTEDNIKDALIKKFGFLDGKIRVQRKRRIFAEMEYSKFKDVFEYAINELKFVVLCTITGLDEGAVLSFIYHLSTLDGIVLNLKVSVPKENPVLKTVTGYFPAADIYEREVKDLLGAKVEGLAEGKRYPLMDEWPQDEYPLRKDWKKDKPKEQEAKNA